MPSRARSDAASDRSGPHRAPDYETERLEREHRDLDARIVDLDRRRYLSGEEEVERRQLQKRKLWIKDRLHALGGAR